MDLEEEVYGEYPPNISHIPGAIKVDRVPHRLLLATEAQKYLAQFPELQDRARQAGKDLVAFASAHGKEIIIGVGVASALTGGVILYRHTPIRKKRSRRRKKKK